MTLEEQKKVSIVQSWRSLFLLTISAILLYVFMEWLFIITKPSALDAVGFGIKIAILLFTCALMVSIAALLLAGLALINRLLSRVTKFNFTFIIGWILPAFVMASLALMLLDNFTYTLFTFGIVTSQGVLRAIYALIFLGLVYYFFRWTSRMLVALNQKMVAGPNWQRLPLLLVAGLLLAGALSILFSGGIAPANARLTGSKSTRSPHILVITADGLDASHLSVYGYERDTTPNLRRLAESALVAENAFSNSSNTSGSIISLLTSKPPASTRVLYPPDILRGSDAYQHLPGLLRLNNYYTVQFSFPHYVDAYTLNVRDGFMLANNKKLVNPILVQVNRILRAEYTNFLYDLANRLIDRLRHIFFIKKMENPALVITNMADILPDSVKIDELINVFDHTTQPVFAHIHLMGTHGDKFYPPLQVFSIGKDTGAQQPYDPDLYDDSILEADAQIGRLIDYLTSRGLLDQTILVIASDHGQRFDATKRLPWIIRFPNGEYAGRILVNVQNMDIAPTILEYMGLNRPVWMQGQSLLDSIDSQRPIFAVGVASAEQGSDQFFRLNVDKLQPPFYQVQRMSVVYCQNWTRLNLTDFQVSSGTVADYVEPCPIDALLSQEEAIELMIQHLQDNGFDTSTLEAAFPESIP